MVLSKTLEGQSAAMVLPETQGPERSHGAALGPRGAMTLPRYGLSENIVLLRSGFRGTRSMSHCGPRGAHGAATVRSQRGHFQQDGTVAPCCGHV